MSPFALIPTIEHEKLMSLTEDQRQEVLFWCRIVQRIELAKSKKAAFSEIARSYPGVKGMTASNIKTKFYAFQKVGWSAFINGSKLKADQKVRVLGDAPTGQSAEFIEFWKGLQESFQRSSAGAYRELIKRYRRGEDIPGVGNWRSVWMDRIGGYPPKNIPIDAPLPEGWSERNLRNYKPKKVELEFSRGGLEAAKKYLPKVYTTRVGMEVGQMYVFDDMWHDLYVNSPGNSQAMRPLEFACQDVFSASRVAWGIQPMGRNPDTGKREMLRETEMRFLVCHVLCNVGYHPDGCVLNVEHGTAAIRKELEELLFEITCGAVTVARGGIDATPAFDGAFAPRGKGNSRFKSTLESQHSLVHNELANLPGQSGKDRDHAPEQLHGMMVYNTKMLAKAANLPPERAELLEMPAISIDQFRAYVNEAYARINQRHDHKLEGYRKAGLVINEYRRSIASAWEPQAKLLTMAEDERTAMNFIIRKRIDEFTRTRQLSPAEVLADGLPKLMKVPKFYAPQILGEKNAKPVRLDTDHFISFEDRRLGPEKLRFYGTIETESGEQLHLDAETTYKIYATPFDTSAIFVCDEDNRFLGIARALNAPCKTHSDAVHREIGRVRKTSNELLGITRARKADEGPKLAAMYKHNNAVIHGDPITATEIETHDRIKGAKGQLADVFEAPADPEEFEEYETEESGTLSDIF